MDRDIRQLFKEDDFPIKKMPKNHRELFLKKLKKTSSSKRLNTTFFLKIVASLVFVFVFGKYVFNKEEKPKKQTLLVQVKQIEKKYLKNIEEEWQKFLSLTNDEKLISNYRERLNMLNESYQQLSKQFEANPNNISLLEELIDNLQRRLKTLKEIQSHIKILNQKNKSYEAIVI